MVKYQLHLLREREVDKEPKKNPEKKNITSGNTHFPKIYRKFITDWMFGCVFGVYPSNLDVEHSSNRNLKCMPIISSTANNNNGKKDGEKTSSHHRHHYHSLWLFDVYICFKNVQKSCILYHMIPIWKRFFTFSICLFGFHSLTMQTNIQMRPRINSGLFFLLRECKHFKHTIHRNQYQWT